MFDRFRDAYRGGGIRGILYNAYAVLFDQWFDLRHGTDTRHRIPLDGLTVESKNKGSGRPYQATRAIPLQQLFTRIKPLLPPESVLLDLGSGKGRVLLIASQFQFREARGIEFARELCEAARKNCAKIKEASGARTAFSVIESDVMDYTIRPEENVFFFYNSFEEPILKRVLANIADSLREADRKVLFICYNPQFRHVIDQQEGFVRILDFRLFEYRFLVYSNHPSQVGQKETTSSRMLAETAVK